MDIVEKIHAEIDSAQDRILKEALDFIENGVYIEDASEKSERLKKLGFVNTPFVHDNEEKIKKLAEFKRKANLVKYYTDNYPFLKFITEEEFDVICKKYDLIYAPANSYRKDIPEKNLIEIENAQPIKSKDAVPVFYTYNLKFFSYVPQEVIEFFSTLKTDKPLSGDNTLRDICPIKYEGKYLYEVSGISHEAIDKTGLFIAAPPSHFDLTGLTENSNKMGFFKVITSKPESKDPIVFRYVNGGIQILSKWGKEAEDENLVNPINN